MFRFEKKYHSRCQTTFWNMHAHTNTNVVIVLFNCWLCTELLNYAGRLYVFCISYFYTHHTDYPVALYMYAEHFKNVSSFIVFSHKFQTISFFLTCQRRRQEKNVFLFIFFLLISLFLLMLLLFVSLMCYLKGNEKKRILSKVRCFPLDVDIISDTHTSSSGINNNNIRKLSECFEVGKPTDWLYSIYKYCGI